MRDYISEDWRETLQAKGLNSFDDWWSLEADWFEPPNLRRGGWSGVSRVELGNKAVFLKRQENHVLRTFLHPFRGILTFVREIENIFALQAAGVPALKPVYFATRNVAGEQRAIVVTEALDGYVSLRDTDRSNLSYRARKQLINEVAAVTRHLHSYKLVHNCLYPQHILVKGGEQGFNVRLIDLEKTRRKWRADSAMFRDLDTLNRHCPEWTISDRTRFLKAYLGDADEKRWRDVWKRFAARERQRHIRSEKHRAQGR